MQTITTEQFVIIEIEKPPYKVCIPSDMRIGTYEKQHEHEIETFGFIGSEPRHS